jgi:uncharacterized membrane protein
MGGLILTVIGIAITIVKLGSEVPSSRAASAIIGLSTPLTLISQLITYLLRFLFHCIQYSFIFRYGNVSNKIGKISVNISFYLACD